jgi:hypothetical protein
VAKSSLFLTQDLDFSGNQSFQARASAILEIRRLFDERQSGVFSSFWVVEVVGFRQVGEVLDNNTGNDASDNLKLPKLRVLSNYYN